MHYNIAQLRTELWTDLKLNAYNLAKKKESPEQEDGKAKILLANETVS